jgi:cell division protein ZapB
LNLLTEIQLHHYSCGMLSEFHQLSDKISHLAELAHSLRRENAELRLQVATLTAENADLSQRIQEASQRVMALLEKIPAPDEHKEEAA